MLSQKLRLNLLCCLCSIVSIFSINADEITELNPVEILSVSSSLYKGNIDFNVTLPPGYADNKDSRYIVMFDFHQRSQPLLSGMHDWMTHNGQWPWLQTLIVTPRNTSEQLTEMYVKISENKTDTQLLDFFEHDLLKAIDGKYRTNGYRIYSGFTGNGSVGLYTLFNRPSLFNAYIIASPVLAEDHAGILSTARSKLKALAGKPRMLLLSNGNSKYEKSHQQGYETLTQLLQSNAPKTLEWQANQFNQYTYMSQPVIATMHGIEAIFKDVHNPLAVDSDISRQGADAILKHYQYLSNQKYGFEVSAAQSLTLLGNALMQDKKTEQALKVFKASADAYPKSAWAIHALAKAYADLEQYNNAIKYQKEARSQANSMSQWHQDKHQQYLEEYRAKADKSAG